MNLIENIKIVQLFQSYSEFYQPYITPVIKALKQNNSLEIKVQAFKGESSNDVELIPTYYKRKLQEKVYNLSRAQYPKLNYVEISYLKQKVDIIHIQHSFLFPKVLGLLKMPNNTRPKVVITLRGGDTYIKPWYYKNWISFYEKYGNKVDAFITVSKHQKKYLHEKWHIDKDRIHVIPVSVEKINHNHPKEPNIKVLRLVSAFRVCWEKNIEGSIQLVRKLKERGIPVKYDIFGDGPDLGQLYYLVDRYHLQDVVNIKGKIANKELMSCLPEYDFFVQLSVSEALSASVLEAQSKGLPCIVSNSDGLVEAVVKDKTAIVADYYNVDKLADDCIDLWKDKEKYREFSENAIQHIKTNFLTSIEVESLVNLYQSLKQ